MAAPKGKKTTVRRRRERKNIERGQRISSLHSTTRLLQSQIHRQRRFLGERRRAGLPWLQKIYSVCSAVGCRDGRKGRDGARHEVR